MARKHYFILHFITIGMFLRYTHNNTRALYKKKPTNLLSSLRKLKYF